MWSNKEVNISAVTPAEYVSYSLDTYSYYVISADETTLYVLYAGLAPTDGPVCTIKTENYKELSLS